MTAAERAVAIGVLANARDLISQAVRWTQGAYARGSDGTSVEVNSPRAVCWCLRGAVKRVAPNRHAEIDASLLLLRHTPRWEAFNDSHTHLQVLDLIDEVLGTIAEPV